MDCSDLDRYLNNEMTEEEKQLFLEHTKHCKVCKMQTEFYTALKSEFVPPLPDDFELWVMNEIHHRPKFYGFVFFALFSALIGIISTITANYFELIHSLKMGHYPHILLQIVDKLNFLTTQFIYLCKHITDSLSSTVSDLLPVGMFFIFLIFMLYNLSLKERL